MGLKFKKFRRYSVLDWCVLLDGIVLLICLIPNLPEGFYKMVSILTAIFCLMCFLDFVINKEWLKSLYFILMTAYCCAYPFLRNVFIDERGDWAVWENIIVFTLLAVVFIGGAIFDTNTHINLKKKDKKIEE